MKKNVTTEQELQALQKRWREDKDDSAYQELFMILVQYARSMILKMTKGKKFLNPDYVFSKAVGSTMSFIERYEKDPEFKIDFSFGGLLKYNVLENLYGAKVRKYDDILSLNALIGDKDSYREIEDLQERFGITPFWSPNDRLDDPVNQMYNTEDQAISTVISVIIDLLGVHSLSNRDTLLILVAVLQLFRKTRTLIRFQETFFYKTELQEIYDLLVLEIRNRLSGEV